MAAIRPTEALGYTVGDTLAISAEAFDARVAGRTPRRLLIEWPWRQIDQKSGNSWDGTLSFPLDGEEPIHIDIETGSR